MKISISYPPLPSEKGVPLLSRNGQFQWFTELLEPNEKVCHSKEIWKDK